MLGYLVDCSLHRFFVGYVDADGQRLASGRPDLVDNRFARALLEVENRDSEAVTAQPFSDGCSDASSGSGDDGGTGLVGHGLSLY